MNPLLESAREIVRRLEGRSLPEPVIQDHGPGIGVTVAIPAAGVSVLLKPCIGRIALQFDAPGFQWEMSAPDHREAMAVAGLEILARQL